MIQTKRLKIPTYQADLLSTWHNTSKPSLPALMELSDVLFERQYQSDTVAFGLDGVENKFRVSYQTGKQLTKLTNEKADCHPSILGKLDEEVAEFLDEIDTTEKSAIEKILKSPILDAMGLVRITSIMGWEPLSVEKLMQYAILKMQGRHMMNDKYPEATCKQRKKALKEFETVAARHVWDA